MKITYDPERERTPVHVENWLFLRLLTSVAGENCDHPVWTPAKENNALEVTLTVEGHEISVMELVKTLHTGYQEDVEASAREQLEEHATVVTNFMHGLMDSMRHVAQDAMRQGLIDEEDCQDLVAPLKGNDDEL